MRRVFTVLVALLLAAPVSAEIVTLTPAQADTLPSIIAAAEANSTFNFTCSGGSVYRPTTLAEGYYFFSLRTGDTYTSSCGAIFEGGTTLTGWTSTTVSGVPVWYVTGQTQEDTNFVGECQSGYSRCNRVEDLFFDGVAFPPVSAAADCATGRYFFDYTANRIYVCQDPTGHTVETTRALFPFYPFCTSDNVTVSGLKFQHFGNYAQFGVIGCTGTTSTGWTVEGNEVRLNHGCGVRTQTGWTVRGNVIHHMGQQGICGTGDDVLIESNALSYNNTQFFSFAWDAGGTKFAQTNRLIIRGNHVHHNFGPGIWLDIDNDDSLIEFNRVEDNNGGDGASSAGIFEEISANAVIRRNQVHRNGLGYCVYGWGAGILIAASPGVEVAENTLTGNCDGIVAIQQDRTADGAGHEIEDLNVHHNVVDQPQGTIGLLQDIGDTSYFTSRNNHFTANVYTSVRPDTFTWGDADKGFSAWQGDGHGTAGAVITPRRLLSRVR